MLSVPVVCPTSFGRSFSSLPKLVLEQGSYSLTHIAVFGNEVGDGVVGFHAEQLTTFLPGYTKTYFKAIRLVEYQIA